MLQMPTQSSHTLMQCRLSEKMMRRLKYHLWRQKQINLLLHDIHMNLEELSVWGKNTLASLWIVPVQSTYITWSFRLQSNKEPKGLRSGKFENISYKAIVSRMKLQIHTSWNLSIVAFYLKRIIQYSHVETFNVCSSNQINNNKFETGADIMV